MHNTINSDPTPTKPIDNPPSQNKPCPCLTLFLSLPLHAISNPFIISRFILFDFLNSLGTLTKGLLVLLLTIFGCFSIRTNTAQVRYSHSLFPAINKDKPNLSIEEPTRVRRNNVEVVKLDPFSTQTNWYFHLFPSLFSHLQLGLYNWDYALNRNINISRWAVNWALLQDVSISVQRDIDVKRCVDIANLVLYWDGTLSTVWLPYPGCKKEWLFKFFVELTTSITMFKLSLFCSSVLLSSSQFWNCRMSPVYMSTISSVEYTL